MGGPSPLNPQNTLNQGNQIASSQQKYNTGTAEQQYGYNAATQQGSQPNQTNQYGSVNYTPTQVGTGPNGVPIYSYTQNTTLSQPEQNIFGLQTGAQQIGGVGAENLLAGANYGAGGVTPAQAVGSMTTGLTGQELGAEVASLQPGFNIQTEQANSNLYNQGITPETNPTAYYAGMLPTATGQATTEANFLANQYLPTEQAAFSQYNDPAALAAQLTPQTVSPTTVTDNMAQMAGTTVQPVNVAAGVSAIAPVDVAQAQQQQAQYNAMLTGLFGLGSAGLGAIAAAYPISGG